MKDVNKVILMGRLGADPIRRETKSGKTVVRLSVATERRLTRAADESDDTGSEEKAVTQWHQVVAWGRQAEACAQYLKKGRAVYVEGSIKSRKYEDKDGNPRQSFEISAREVNFLPGRTAPLASVVAE
ncbi:MAG: single-stranded DNA-binding protein [Bacteriovoracia bacterium]